MADITNQSRDPFPPSLDSSETLRTQHPTTPSSVRTSPQVESHAYAGPSLPLHQGEPPPPQGKQATVTENMGLALAGLDRALAVD